MHGTVVYYTGNHEDETFEAKIRAKLLDTIGDMPLISVSQKPIDFGKNICVGEHEISIHNAWRQLLIGAEQATTPFIYAAESDYLYPKEHFQFIPERKDAFYMPDPLYMMFMNRPTPEFRLKPTGCEGTIVVAREHLITRLRLILDEHGMWSPFVCRLSLFRRGRSVRFPVSVSPIMFKTDKGMTQFDHHRQERLKSLPGWGLAKDIYRMYAPCH
jgi:hypothetical protein